MINHNAAPMAYWPTLSTNLSHEKPVNNTKPAQVNNRNNNVEPTNEKYGNKVVLSALPNIPPAEK